MLKSIWLSILGWLRITAAKNTNLEYAGKEQIHQARQDIEKLRTERNKTAAKGVGVERRLKQAQNEASKAVEAVKHWDAQGDSVRKQQAYDLYVQNTKEVAVQEEMLAGFQTQVKDLDAKISELENVVNQAENKVSKAAATQTHARAANKAEDLHDRFKNGGDLGLATQLAQESSDLASVRTQTRKDAEAPDVLNYEKGPAVKSMDDLLGSNTHSSSSSSSDSGSSSSDSSSSSSSSD